MDDLNSAVMYTADDGLLATGYSAFINTWNQDPRAVWSSFSMIVVSEIGDKTFLIAAILAMRQPRPIVFLGAFGALAVMSVLSALLGVMFPTLLPKWLTTLAAALLFFAFGIRMMREAFQMTGDELGEEWEDAKRQVEEEQDHVEAAGGGADGQEQMELRNLEEGGETTHEPIDDRRSNGNGHSNNEATLSSLPKSIQSPLRSAASTAAHMSTVGFKDGARNLCSLCFSPIFAQAFVLTFLGEWGDRSQIATIALAAAHNIVLVSFGTIVGHALCTGMAVMAGSWIARRISIKHVTIGGAALFLIFGVIYLYESISGAGIDLSPIAAANAAPPNGDSLPPEAIAAMKLPYLPVSKAAERIAKVPRSIIHSLYQLI